MQTPRTATISSRRCTKCEGLLLPDTLRDPDTLVVYRFLRCVNCCRILFEIPGEAIAVVAKTRPRHTPMAIPQD